MKIINDNLIRDSRAAYLIGIGGSGMSGLARILKHLGLSVSGSDSKETAITQTLNRSGIPVHIANENVSAAYSIDGMAPRVLVPASRAEEAQEIIAEIQQSSQGFDDDLDDLSDEPSEPQP